MYSVHVLLIVGFLCSLRHFHSFIIKTLFNHKSDTHLLFFYLNLFGILLMKLKCYINTRRMIYLYLSIFFFKHEDHRYLQLIYLTSAQTSTNMFLSSVGRQWYWKLSGDVQFWGIWWQFISYALFVKSSTDLGHSCTIFFVEIDAKHALFKPITWHIWPKEILLCNLSLHKNNSISLTDYRYFL